MSMQHIEAQLNLMYHGIPVRHRKEFFDAVQAWVDTMRDAKNAALTVLRLIIEDLPTNRDWLDPTLERRARALVYPGEEPKLQN
jgi:hypothetical protein